MSFQLTILVGMASVPVALICVFLVAGGLHGLLACAVGAILWVPGCRLGVNEFCFSEGAGNLCGLAGVFGTGPLAFSLTAFAYAAVFWLFKKLVRVREQWKA